MLTAEPRSVGIVEKWSLTFKCHIFNMQIIDILIVLAEYDL